MPSMALMRGIREDEVVPYNGSRSIICFKLTLVHLLLRYLFEMYK
jgi:hypothetical protein